VIRFLGLHLGPKSADAVCLGRDLSITAEASAPVANVRFEDGEAAVVAPAEWVRAGCFVLQELYWQLRAADRKLWGLGLAGPGGWIALDVEFEPLTELRLLDHARVVRDLRSWLEGNPRPARRLAAVLSPKDYFRFAVSRALATDVTQASRLGLVADDACDWCPDRVAQAGLDPRWLPPVFESESPTTRISEDGVRRTGLPGGLWIVAGAESRSASLVASGDLRQQRLWAPQGHDRVSLLVTPSQAALGPKGFQRFRAPLPGYSVLEPASGAVPDSAAAPEAELEARRRELDAAGLSVCGVERSSGRPQIGAAALAAVGSRLIRSWDGVFSALAAPTVG
jgi:sugar (pentulose or hexulose) kinase